MKHKKSILLLLLLIFIFCVVGDTFGVAGYEISITIIGSGTVSKNPNKTYYSDESVTLTAVPDKGWKFVRWEGDLAGSDNPEIVYVGSASKNVNATFEKLPNDPSKNLLLLDE